MPVCSICNFKIHIEVPLLLLFFAFTFSDSIKTNFIIFRTCYVTLGYNKSECALLGSKEINNETAHLEKIVEPYAAVLNMVHSLSDAFFSAILCIFVGPWSDKFGRKPFLVFPAIGFFLSYTLFSIFSVFENVSPWYSLLCSIPTNLSGGGASYLTVILCYISDVTDEGNRGLRMGIFEAILALGIFLGNISSSYVFAATNYPTIFGISALCCFLNLFYTIFFIPESLTDPETEGRFRSFFQLTNVKDMVQTTFRPRESYDRYIILTCVFMLTIFIVIINGDGAVIFLFLREKFRWTLEHYTLFSAAHNITWVVGTVIGISLLHKILKLPEKIMIVIGFTSMFLGNLILGLAQLDWEVYVGAISKSLGGVLSPMVRTLVSKVLPKEELGKVFAWIVVSESLFGMAGSPTFTAIYNATISTDPAIFNFVAAAIYFVEVLLALSIILVTSTKYVQLPNADQASECEDH